MKTKLQALWQACCNERATEYINSAAFDNALRELIAFTDIVDEDCVLLSDQLWVAVHFVQNKQVGKQDQITRLHSKIRSSYLNGVGYHVDPIEERLGLTKQAHPIRQIAFKLQQAHPQRRTNYTAYIDPIGDDNCGPRAVIQSLLLQGVLKGQQDVVHRLLSDMFERFKADPRLYQSQMNDDHTSKYANDYLVGRQIQKQVAAFLETYRTLSPTVDNLTALRRLMPNRDRAWPEDDGIIYVLSACLRFDMAKHIEQRKHVLLTPTGALALERHPMLYMLVDADTQRIGTLNTGMEFAMACDYFASKQILLEMYSPSRDSSQPRHYVDNTNDIDMVSLQITNASLFPSDVAPQLKIPILRPGGSHFITLIDPSQDRLCLAPEPVERPKSQRLGTTIEMQQIESNTSNWPWLLNVLANPWVFYTCAIITIAAIALAAVATSGAAIALVVVALLHTTPAILAITSSVIAGISGTLFIAGFFGKSKVSQPQQEIGADLDSESVTQFC